MECHAGKASLYVQTSVWFPDDPARKALLQRWAIAFVWCAMDHVREDCDLEPPLQARPLTCATFRPSDPPVGIRVLTCVALSRLAGDASEQ